MFSPPSPQNTVRVGVGYRPAFEDVFLSPVRPDVSWIEVITENFLPQNGLDTLATQTLRRLRRDFPVALHGVNLSLASAGPLNEEYLRHLAWLEREIEPFLVTDHLCWTGVGEENLFDLLPFPHCREALELVAGKISRVQDLLRRPIGVENITYYVEPLGGDQSEEEFLNELARRTGCLFLLDVNNIFVNSKNLGVDPLAYLSRLDLRHVAEIHLAGHTEHASGLLIDTHAAPVKEEVWALYEWVQARIGVVPTMIERDENIPAWSEMERELGRLRTLQAKGKEDHRETPFARMAGTVSL